VVDLFADIGGMDAKSPITASMTILPQPPATFQQHFQRNASVRELTTESTSASLPAAQPQRQRQSERIMVISIFYTCSFYATYGLHTMSSPVHLLGGFENAEEPMVHAFAILNNTILPLQGLFNSLKYLFPRYQKYKRERQHLVADGSS
jgi:hypothetical protein